jgi:hypothetical protein
VPAGVFDADEAAFVKTCLTSPDAVKSVQGCDCWYHDLRGQGVPASTLAVASSDLIDEFGSRIGKASADC